MKAVKKIYKAQKINMGGIILDQALPVNDLTYFDPFLLIHHWKQEFKGGEKQSELGVGPHPHRGFSPVTLILEGGVYHQDSIGNISTVEKDGVQWMNSGKGIIHSERPSKKIAEDGGIFEIIQFWVNTPKKFKKDDPNYQALDVNEIPVIIYDGGLVKMRIIAGEYEGIKSKIDTRSELLILSVNFSFGGKISIQIPDGMNAILYLIKGKLNINNSTNTSSKELTVFDKHKSDIHIEATADTQAILFAGKPHKEPIVSHGPFVMNNSEEIYEAISDYRLGKMGVLNEKFEEEIGNIQHKI